MLHALARLLRENEANTRCVQALLPDSRNRSERKTDVHTLRSVPLIRSCDFLCGLGRQSTSEIHFTATRRHTICELPGPMSIYYFKGVLRYFLCVLLMELSQRRLISNGDMLNKSLQASL